MKFIFSTQLISVLKMSKNNGFIISILIILLAFVLYYLLNRNDINSDRDSNLKNSNDTNHSSSTGDFTESDISVKDVSIEPVPNTEKKRIRATIFLPNNIDTGYMVIKVGYTTVSNVRLPLSNGNYVLDKETFLEPQSHYSFTVTVRGVTKVVRV